jgi:hypothetical protein
MSSNKVKRKSISVASFFSQRKSASTNTTNEESNAIMTTMDDQKPEGVGGTWQLYHTNEGCYG